MRTPHHTGPPHCSIHSFPKRVAFENDVVAPSTGGINTFSAIFALFLSLPILFMKFYNEDIKKDSRTTKSIRFSFHRITLSWIVTVNVVFVTFLPSIKILRCCREASEGFSNKGKLVLFKRDQAKKKSGSNRGDSFMLELRWQGLEGRWQMPKRQKTKCFLTLKVGLMCLHTNTLYPNPFNSLSTQKKRQRMTETTKPSTSNRNLHLSLYFASQRLSTNRLTVSES